MKRTRKRFTTGPIGGERGRITLLATLLLSLLALFIMFSTKKLLLLNEERKQRTQTYLCLKSAFDLYASLQKFMKRTNLSIVTLNAAIIAFKNPALHTMKKMVQRSQELKLLTLSSKLYSRSCQGLQLKIMRDAYPLKSPFPTLKRTLSGTVLLRKKPQSLFLTSRKSYPFLFVIKGKITFAPRLLLTQSKEVLIGPQVRF